MSRSSGTYTAPTNSFNPAVEGTEIDEGDWNTLLDDLEAALTESTYTAGLGSTDNRLVRTDGTDTKKIQGTGITVDDSDNVTGVASITATTVNVGNADTTLSRTGAGDIAVEGNAIYRASGTDVPIADGGTGQSTATAAFDALAPTTTQGDIIYHNGTNNVRLGTGTAGQVLTSGGAGANPSWGSAGAGDVTGQASSVDSEIALFSGTGGKTIKRASTTGLLKGTSGVLSAASEGTDYYAPSGTDVAIADGGTGASTAAAGFRALAEGISSTQGAVLYRDGSQWTALTPGTSGQVLQTGGAGANPSWASVAGTGDVTAASSFGTDNRLIRSDGTGKGVQASGITIDDSDNVTGVTKVNGVTLRPVAPGVLVGNLTVTASVASSALTVALKTEAGTDASATDPIVLAFRSPTEATGTYSVVTITAALSLTISSGSTMGATNSVAFPLWLVCFNDGGTARLGLINTVSGTNVYPLGAYAVASSTAEGGAGAADSAHVFYTGTAVTSKAYVTLARLGWSSGLGTVGTWSAGPTRIQLMDGALRLPNTMLQVIESGTVTMTTGSTTVPADDTIPQNTEGNQYFSQAITPISAAHVLRFTVLMNGSISTGSNALVIALFQDSTANALAASWQNGVAAGAFFSCPFVFAMLAGTASSTTFKIRAGPISAGTYTLNGVGGARYMGGVAYSNFQITEIAT